jgi:hypothetical protein
VEAEVAADSVVGGVTALVETVSIALVADPSGGIAAVLEFVSAAGSGWIREWSGSFDGCSKAARAAWPVLLWAQPEMKLVPRTTHKPSKIVAFMKCSFGVKRKQTACRRKRKGCFPSPQPST